MLRTFISSNYSTKITRQESNLKVVHSFQVQDDITLLPSGEYKGQVNMTFAGIPKTCGLGISSQP